MKSILCFIVILSSTNLQLSKHYNSNIFIPKEYRYPEDSLLSGKTFVMQKEGSTIQNYVSKWLRLTSSGKLLIEKRYSGAYLDSTIYLNEKMIETYNNTYKPGVLLKGEILQDTIVHDGSKLGRDLQKTVYHTSKVDILVNSQQQYWKDTTLIWDHHSVDCIIVKGEVELKFSIPNDTSGIQTLSYFHTYYYGKGLGLLRFTTRSDDDFVIFNLKVIQSIAGI